MVDFRKKLGVKSSVKITHPCELYEKLDRASDKGPLRPAQEKILNEWFDTHSNKKDIILKLHTGQGKTLIALLILQARINQDSGPALYLCPDNYLVEQTCKEAESFGISYVIIEDEIPEDFINGKCILITTASKLFNGKTKFGLGTKALKISTIILDDAHACIDYVRRSYTISLKRNNEVYQQILNLFGPEMEKQGVGTFADIKNGEYKSFITIPYWDWQDKYVEVASMLSKNKDMKDIKFAWQILKDIIKDCRCIVSGDSLEITPYLSPIDIFGSFSKADHRIFMSATVNNDAFFIKGFGLNTETIKNPLQIEKEKWSGEKMILIPSMVHESLNRTEIVNLFAQPRTEKKYGVVALVPGFEYCKDWEQYGSVIATAESIYDEVDKLRNKNFDKSLVIANRYDGIDLPDHTCRILIMDSKPFSGALEDRYLESCRSTSEIITIKLAQVIEQGFGRAVRGEKDYCALIIVGNELVRTLRSRDTKKFFSEQTKTQVEIGLEIAEFAVEEINSGKQPIEAFNGLINQLLNRDEGWKDFYTDRMESIDFVREKENIIDIFFLEYQAEKFYKQGKVHEAMTLIQEIIDKYIGGNQEERGWYMQEMARYCYSEDTIEASKLQVSAHSMNSYLFKPKEGVKPSKMPAISIKRIENIISIFSKFDTFEELILEINNTISSLRFGVDSDRFEKSLCELGNYLGFVSQRPDKESNEGPDNLWKVEDNQYWVIECKNKVSTNRVEINKEETGQMNNSCSWFKKMYGDIPVKYTMIIPTKKINKAAGFNLNVGIMREKGLSKLRTNVTNFFKEFQNFDLKSLSEKRIQLLLDQHQLTVPNLISSLYSEDATHY